MKGWMFFSAAIAETEITPTMLEGWLKSLVPRLGNLAKTVLIAALVFFCGRKLIRLLLRLTGAFLKRRSVEESVAGFLLKLAGIAFHVVLILAVAAVLGMETGSLIALVGSTGLTIGLALQGSLSNFAGGVLILLLKPFRLGDYIIAGTDEGAVAAIDIFYTKLLTIDNRLIIIPNGTLSNLSLINVTNESLRRLDLYFAVDYSEQIKRVKDILSSLVEGNEMVLKEEHEIDIFVSSFEASAMTLGLRVWTKGEDYWKLKWSLLEEIKEAFDREGIRIPYNQLDVHVKNKEEQKG